MPVLEGEPVARAIRDHQAHASGQWVHRQLVPALHTWVDRFDRDFNLGLPMPVIAIAPLPATVRSDYQVGHSDLGTRTTITLNARWLPPASSAVELLATLLHECGHAWEEWQQGRERSGWYHTAAWRRKMAACGVVADTHGHLQELPPRFVQYLERYGVADLAALAATRRPAEATPGSRLRKIICPACGYTLRGARKWLTAYPRYPICPCGTELVADFDPEELLS